MKAQQTKLELAVVGYRLMSWQGKLVVRYRPRDHILAALGKRNHPACRYRRTFLGSKAAVECE